MRVNVYIDGFNFYFGAVRGTPYRWLDFSKLCRLLLPRDHVNRIRYFTALVEARPDDPTKQQRQQTFIGDSAMPLAKDTPQGTIRKQVSWWRSTTRKSTR